MSRPRRPRRWWLALGALVVALWLLRDRIGFTPDGSEDAAQLETPVETTIDEAEPPPEPDPEPAEAEELATPTELPAVVEAPAPPPDVRLFGSCRFASDGAPAAGVLVRLLDADGTAREARSDGAGRFEAAWPAGRAVRVESPAQRGFTLAYAPHDLATAESAGEAEILLELTREPVASLRGRLVDASTGDGVFGLALEVRGATWTGTTEHGTDEHGDFATVRALSAGSYHVDVYDEAPEGRVPLGSADVVHDPILEPDRSHLLSVALGPTYFALLVGAERAIDAGWQVRLVERAGDPELAGVLARAPSGWQVAPLAAEVEQLDWSWRALRSDPRRAHFVRYPAAEHDTDPARTRHLQVRSADGTWFGETTIREAAEPGTRALPITLRPRPVATLDGRLVDGAGDPIAGAQLWLTSDDHTPIPGPWTTNAEGRFAVPALAPGPHRLAVRSGDRPGIELSIQLTAGRNDLGPLLVPPPEGRHVLRGEFVCNRGHGPASVMLEVRDRAGRHVSRVLVRRVASSDELSRRTTGRFAADDLPPGEYVLRPVEVSGGHHWAPDELRVETPTPELRFECTGDHPVDRARVEAEDAESGDPIGDVRVYLGPVLGKPFSWPESRPRERWYAWPRDTALPWTAWAPGYQPALASPSPNGRGGARNEIVVDLRRGYGARLLLRERPTGGSSTVDPASAQPVQGVRVVAGGLTLGSTDDYGELVFGLDVAPDALRLLHPRWKLTAVDATPTDADGLPTIVAWLVARP